MQIWLPDQSTDIFQALLAAFPTQFVSRFSCENLATDVSRVARLPVEVFKAARKCCSASPASPALLFSVGDVIKHLSLMLSVATDAVVDPLELELLAIHFCHQVFGSRELCGGDVMTKICLQAAKRLRFDAHSVTYVGTAEKFYFADNVDADGFTRFPYAVVEELYCAGEDRFHWYHRSAPKDSAASGERSQPPTLPTASNPPTPSSHTRPSRSHSFFVKEATGAPATEASNSVQVHFPVDEAQRRRHSLVAAAGKMASSSTTATPSPYTVHNMLSVYASLKGGAHTLLLTGGDSCSRRSAVRVACGVLSFQFKEIAPQVKKPNEFADRLKAAVLDAVTRATPTLVYLECEFLASDEFEVALAVAMQHQVPADTYSTVDRAQILACDHQFRSLRASHVSPPLTKPRSAFRENLKRCLYVVLSFRCVGLLLVVQCCVSWLH